MTAGRRTAGWTGSAGAGSTGKTGTAAPALGSFGATEPTAVAAILLTIGPDAAEAFGDTGTASADAPVGEFDDLGACAGLLLLALLGGFVDREHAAFPALAVEGGYGGLATGLFAHHDDGKPTGLSGFGIERDGDIGDLTEGLKEPLKAFGLGGVADVPDVDFVDSHVR